MTTIKHVLIPTDGSSGACKAAAFAGELARALNARVTVLMVQDENLVIPLAWDSGEYSAAATAGAASVEQVRDLLEQRVRDKELPDTVSAIGKLAAEPHVVTAWGHPVDEICRFADENDVDLIVIGSHGRSGLKRALLGSVSHAVANHAPCPVTIVR